MSLPVHVACLFVLLAILLTIATGQRGAVDREQIKTVKLLRKTSSSGSLAAARLLIFFSKLDSRVFNGSLITSLPLPLASDLLCEAAMTLNLEAVNYLLSQLGIPATVAHYSAKYSQFYPDTFVGRSALHCISALHADFKSTKLASIQLIAGRSHFHNIQLSFPTGERTGKLSHDALMFAQKHGYIDMKRFFSKENHYNAIQIAKVLLKAGGDSNAKNMQGDTPLHFACRAGLLEVARVLLVEGHGNPNEKNFRQQTPLHLAALYGDVFMLQLLLKHNGDLHVKDLAKVSPLDIISKPGTIYPEDAQNILDIKQREARQIDRSSSDVYNGKWSSSSSSSSSNGGWSQEYWQGASVDLAADCKGIDQYYSHEITAKELFRDYLAMNSPVLIRGLLDSWGARDLWRKKELIANFGFLKIQVSSIPYASKFNTTSDSEVSTLSEYLQSGGGGGIATPSSQVGSSEREIERKKYPWYIFKGYKRPHESEHKSSPVKAEHCPIPQIIADAFAFAVNISADLPPSSSFLLAKKHAKLREMNAAIANAREMKTITTTDSPFFQSNQWAVGVRGSGAPFHYHYAAFNALIYGSKKWLLLPPIDRLKSIKHVGRFIEEDLPSIEKEGDEDYAKVESGTTATKGFPWQQQKKKEKEVEEEEENEKKKKMTNKQKRRKIQTCVTTSGDVLLVPQMWGHAVQNLQVTSSSSSSLLMRYASLFCVQDVCFLPQSASQPSVTTQCAAHTHTHTLTLSHSHTLTHTHSHTLSLPTPDQLRLLLLYFSLRTQLPSPSKACPPSTCPEWTGRSTGTRTSFRRGWLLPATSPPGSRPRGVEEVEVEEVEVVGTENRINY